MRAPEQVEGAGVEVRAWQRRLLTPRVVAALNPVLDRLVRPTVTVAGRQASPFRLCGYAGLAVAIAVSQVVVAAHGVSSAVMAWLTLTAVATFLALVTVTTLVVGEETIVYYHHQVAVLGTGITLLRVMDQPILAYLDAVILGIGGFLVCGRVGCLLVGCCHGRPARWGARYGQEHADLGFTPGYVGVRLLPVQLLESLAVAGIVLAGVAQVAGGAPPGRALVWYVAAYGAVRCWLELLRGDPGRPHVWGLSHGQWTSLALVGGVTVAARAGWLPGVPSVSGVALATTSAAGLLASVRWRRDPRAAQVLGPRHLAEIAEMLRDLAGRPSGLHLIGPSSAGVIISTGNAPGTGQTSPADTVVGPNDLAAVEGGDNFRHSHYGFSAHPHLLSPGVAHGLGSAVLRTRHPEALAGNLLAGQNGVQHLLIRETPPDAAPMPLTSDAANRSDCG